MVCYDFLWGKKHEFDMENPYIDRIESYHKHSLSGKNTNEEMGRSWMAMQGM